MDLAVNLSPYNFSISSAIQQEIATIFSNPEIIAGVHFVEL